MSNGASKNRTKCLPIALLVAMLLFALNVRAQFSGSVGLGINSTSNASGTDTSSPDRPWLPSVDLQYRLALSRLNSLTFEATTNPYYSSLSPEYSYSNYDLGLTALFYLSEDRPLSEMDDGHNATSSLNTMAHHTNEPHVQTGESQSAANPIVQASAHLVALQMVIDSSEIDAHGLSEDSTETAGALRDSLSESLAAMSEILTSSEFTPSVLQVLTEELDSDTKLLAAIPFDNSIEANAQKALLSVRMLLQQSTSTSEALSTEVVAEDPIAKTLPKTIQHKISIDRQSEPVPSPILSLVTPATDLTSFGSSDVLLRDDAPEETTTTFATSLSIPVLFEKQTNQPKYEEYSNSLMSVQPRLNTFIGHHLSLGLLYGFGYNHFPNDSLYSFNENRLRFDVLVSVGNIMVIGAQIGLGAAHYLHPFDSLVSGPRGKILEQYKENTNYTKTVFGAEATFFVGGRTTASLIGVLSRSASLHPYIINAVLGRSKIGAEASDDPYSYNLTRFGISVGTRIFWDISPTIDFAVETRSYGKGLFKSNSVVSDRTDNGTLVDFDVSRICLFDDALLGIFDSFTPEVSVGYSTYKSSVKRYSYDDLSATLNVSLSF